MGKTSSVASDGRTHKATPGFWGKTLYTPTGLHKDPESGRPENHLGRLLGLTIHPFPECQSSFPLLKGNGDSELLHQASGTHCGGSTASGWKIEGIITRGLLSSLRNQTLVKFWDEQWAMWAVIKILPFSTKTNYSNSSKQFSDTGRWQ